VLTPPKATELQRLFIDHIVAYVSDSIIDRE